MYTINKVYCPLDEISIISSSEDGKLQNFGVKKSSSNLKTWMSPSNITIDPSESNAASVIGLRGSYI